MAETLMNPVPATQLKLFELPIENSAFAIDPDRDQTYRHLAFGRGAHQCLGMHLARLQIEEGLHMIAQRIKHPELAGAVAWRRFPGVWGIESLPIRFSPAAASEPTRTSEGA